MMRKTRRTSGKQQPELLWHDAWGIIKSSLISVIITLVCFIIFAMAIRLLDLQETLISPVVQVIRTVSIAFGGFIAARVNRKQGWLRGALTGLLYILWAFIISSLFGNKIDMGSLVFSDILLGLIVGAVGGIIGINI